MTLSRIKTLYCTAVIAIAIILDCVGGWIGWVTAIVVLSGALPMFEAVKEASEHIGAKAALIGFHAQLAVLQASVSQNQSTHPSEPDH